MSGLLLFALSTLVQSFAQAPVELTCPLVPQIQQRYVTTHLTQNKITPELEKRTIKQFMKRQDGSRMFLLDGDYRAIEASLKNVFAKVAGGDCEAILKSQEIWQKRVEERTAFVKKYLSSPEFKIEKSWKFETDAEKRKRPKTQAEAERMLKGQIQFDIANYVGSDINAEEAKKHVTRNYERVLKHANKLKPKDALGSFVDAFATAMDPHSNYMPAEAHEDFEINMKLALEGIGASLGWKNGFTVVERLLPGGAALSSGSVKVKDKIIAVAQGKDGPFVDVIEMELRDVIKLIRGPKGTVVRLKLLRKPKGETQVQRLEVTLNRAKITLEEQAAFSSYIERDLNGKKMKIAFVNLPSFYADQTKDGKSATNDLRRLVSEANEKKADAMVLDLAGNGGGSLQDAVDVAGLFFPKGEVLRVGRGGRFQGLADEDGKTFWSGPLVILTNRVSASASEIVAGALQDYRRAIVVGGDHTYGKGTVQAVEQLPPGLGALKTTTAMFFTAGGQSTQHRGVDGDIVFPSHLAQDSISEKKLDYSLPPQKIAPFLSADAYTITGPEAWKVVKPDVIKKLKTQAQKRINANKDFKKIRTEMAKPKPSTLVSILSLLKGKDPLAGKAEEDDEKDTLPTREERIKEYLKSAEVNEAVDIAAGLAFELKN